MFQSVLEAENLEKTTISNIVFSLDFCDHFSNFDPTIRILSFLDSANADLLKNVQNPRCFRSQEISKTKVSTCFKHPVFMYPVQLTAETPLVPAQICTKTCLKYTIRYSYSGWFLRTNIFNIHIRSGT